RGEAHVRSFAEWRLLARLRELGLPVPRPCAARYRRHGACYSADLLTVRMPDIEPLSSRIARATDPALWRTVGRGLRRFHDAGVYHADLNAYNVQLDAEGGIVLLDFDRGEIRTPGAWQHANLARLERSLYKLKGLDPALEFTRADWASLLAAYEGR
ncbi:MAG TPA: 3-deoxy-D-manno-octulosonic acid kinase, partial [Woeseiaceae bacterium]